MKAFIQSEMARAISAIPGARWEVDGAIYRLYNGHRAHSVRLDPDGEPPSKQDMRELLSATIADAIASDLVHRKQAPK